MPHLTGWFVSEEISGHNHEIYEESANNPDIYIEAEKYGTIAQLTGGLLKDRRVHARLIAAAPDGHDIILAVHEFFRHWNPANPAALLHDDGPTLKQAVERYIAKTTGGAS